MRIEIDGLTEAELIDLNHRIVERLKFLNHMRAHAQMLEFRIGDRVSFQPEGRPAQVGMLTRYNKKTVTVITESGEHWNVAPGLLRRVNSTQSGRQPFSQCDSIAQEVSGEVAEEKKYDHEVVRWVRRGKSK